jgi:hypothetical protein
MKTIQFSIINNGTEFTKQVTVDAANKSKVFGTCMFDFFRLINLQAEGHVKLFKMSQTFDLRIEYNDKVIDTRSAEGIPVESWNKLKTKFKLNKTAASKRRFAKRVYAVLDFATTSGEVLTMKQLEDKLSEDK